MSSLTAARTAPRPASGRPTSGRPASSRATASRSASGRSASSRPVCGQPTALRPAPVLRPVKDADPTARRVHGVGRAPRRLRLTGRGRVLLVLGLVALMLSAFAVGRSASSQATPEPKPVTVPTAITIQPGDTLWSVAERLAPARDPRELVAQIRRLNDLPTASLQVGQQLLVPAAA